MGGLPTCELPRHMRFALLFIGRDIDYSVIRKKKKEKKDFRKIRNFCIKEKNNKKGKKGRASLQIITIVF